MIACTFEIPEYLKEKKCKVEVLFRPFVPDNQDHWQVFDNAAQIIRFLHCIDYPQDNAITLEDQMHNQSLSDIDAIELSWPLENNFNRHDEYKGRRAELVDVVVEINIGTPVSPKMVKIGKNASPKERKEIENLILGV